jgi:hypothetical protein
MKRGRSETPCLEGDFQHGTQHHPAHPVILLLIGAVPAWPHSRGWGYGPSGLLGVVLVILIILLLMGRL